MWSFSDSSPIVVVEYFENISKKAHYLKSSCLNVDLNGISNIDAIELIEKEIEKNSESIVENLKKKIRQNKWENYSFYVYILPFNNAKDDRKDIMKYILG